MYTSLHMYSCSFFGAWAWSKTLDCYRLPVFVTFVPFVETNFCLNSPSRPWWIWANCLLHASYQLPVAQHHAWPIKNWQNWCGTANIDSCSFFEQFAAWVANNQIVVDENTYGANPPRQPNLDLLCWCFSGISKQPSIPFWDSSELWGDRKCPRKTYSCAAHKRRPLQQHLV